MAYTDIDKPSDYFETKLYTGNSTGSTQQAITGLDFSPNMVWIKPRSDAEKHSIADTVRGATKTIHPHLADAEETSAGHMVSFDANGYTVGVDNYSWNKNGSTYASWNWKAGTSFTNDASATGIGSIDSTGSVNTDAGFSICSFTGNGTSGASVKHGLSTKPAMMIIKNRDEADSWQVYHHKNTSAPATETLQLNETGATSDTSNRWNDTEPTTAIFTLGDNPTVNKNTIKYIGYIFSEKKGYSKFGSYVGNGNVSGSYIHLGFSPAWFMIKRTDSASSWRIWDNKRDTFNVRDTSINANEADAEYTDASVYIDFLSNGVKFRNTSDNVSGASYIYMAFAENPFVSSTGVPATAR